MLAEGEHTGIEARVVRLKEGKIDNSAEAFSEHPMKRKPPLASSENGKACPQSACYLEIEEEQDFAIIVTIKQPIKDKSIYWAVTVWVDGRYIDDEIVTSSTGLVLEWEFCQMTFHKGRRRMVGKLQFGKLATTSIASEVSLNVPECDLGSIKVRVDAGTRGKRRRIAKEPKINADVGVADEVKAKRVSSAVSSIKALVAPKRNPQCLWTPRSDGKLKHEFKFSYRTRAVLEALDVIPPPLLPTQLENHGDEDDVKDETDSLAGDGQEESSDLLAINKALEWERMAKRNRENAELRRALKRLRSSDPQETKQIVDLTGDDTD